MISERATPHIIYIILIIILILFTFFLLTVIMYQYKYKINKDYLIGSWLDVHENLYIINRDSISIYMQNGRTYTKEIDIGRQYLSLSNNVFVLHGDEVEFKCICYPVSAHMDLYMNGNYVSVLAKNSLKALNDLVSESYPDKKEEIFGDVFE